MTRSKLQACPSCARHARVDEARCPFCNAPFGEADLPRTPPVPPVASVRLSRAALYAAGVSALSLTVAQGCGGEVRTGNDGGNTNICCPPYGIAPPIDSGGGDDDASTGDASADEARPDAAEDGGADATEDGAADATEEDARTDVNVMSPGVDRFGRDATLRDATATTTAALSAYPTSLSLPIPPFTPPARSTPRCTPAPTRWATAPARTPP